MADSPSNVQLPVPAQETKFPDSATQRSNSAQDPNTELFSNSAHFENTWAPPHQHSKEGSSLRVLGLPFLAGFSGNFREGIDQFSGSKIWAGIILFTVSCLAMSFGVLQVMKNPFITIFPLGLADQVMLFIMTALVFALLGLVRATIARGLFALLREDVTFGQTFRATCLSLGTSSIFLFAPLLICVMWPGVIDELITPIDLYGTPTPTPLGSLLATTCLAGVTCTILWTEICFAACLQSIRSHGTPILFLHCGVSAFLLALISMLLSTTSP